MGNRQSAVGSREWEVGSGGPFGGGQSRNRARHGKGRLNRSFVSVVWKMTKSNEQIAREHRLAAKLRENLKRRKEQARARAQDEVTSGRTTEIADPPDLSAGLKPAPRSDS